MNIKEKNLENATIELSIEINSGKVNTEFEKVFKNIQKTAKVNGFRKGKAPLGMIKTNYNKDAGKQVVENLVKDSYAEAIKEKNITPIAYPAFDFKPVKADNNFAFTARVEVAPTIKLKDYKGISADESQCKIKDTDIDFEIEALQEKHAEISKKEDNVQIENGDLVKLKAKKIDDAKKDEYDKIPERDFTAIAGKSKEDYLFDKYVNGMKVGDEKEVKVKYPANFQIKELAEKKVTWLIKIAEISNRKLPELDDEFAKDLGDYESIKDLKNKTRENLEKYVQEKSRGESKSKILQKIIDKASFDIPGSMIEREKQAVFQRFQQRVGHNIEDMDKFAQMVGMKPEDFSKKMKEDAIQSIKSTLVLSEIVKSEKFTVSDDMYKEAISKLAIQYQKNESEINNLIDKNGSKPNIESELLFNKAMDFIYEKANIKKLSPISAKEFLKNN